MSKHSTSRLTASRKKRARRRAACSGVDWIDALSDHCHSLATLAGLMEACAEPPDPELIAATGHLLSREIKQMRAVLAAAWKEAC